MKCPFCKKTDTKVLESRDAEGALRRRRECIKCDKRFTTYERMEATNLFVVKRNGSRQQYNREKLRNGIMRACEKRPISSVQIDKMIEEIESELRTVRASEVPSTKIGELVMRHLKHVDKIAYIRFASVYLDFKDPEDFEAATRELMKKK